MTPFCLTTGVVTCAAASVSATGAMVDDSYSGGDEGRRGGRRWKKGDGGNMKGQLVDDMNGDCRQDKLRTTQCRLWQAPAAKANADRGGGSTDAAVGTRRWGRGGKGQGRREELRCASDRPLTRTSQAEQAARPCANPDPRYRSLRSVPPESEQDLPKIDQRLKTGDWSGMKRDDDGTELSCSPPSLRTDDKESAGKPERGHHAKASKLAAVPNQTCKRQDAVSYAQPMGKETASRPVNVGPASRGKRAPRAWMRGEAAKRKRQRRLTGAVN